MPELNAELALLPAEQLLDGYARQDFSPVDVLQAVTERVARFNGGINAFAAMAPGALAEAGRSAVRWRAGRPIGALDGVPCTVADLLDVAGLPTRRGSRLGDPAPATDDSPAVMGLRAAGALVIGKTTTAEFGWKIPGDCPLHGITRNPWDPTRTASAGAGAAGAACFGPLHLGMDPRIPAAWCGLVGLQPSFGRVPHWPPGPFAAIGGAGVLTRTVGDCALMLSAIGRADRRDPSCLPDDGRDWRDGLVRGVAGLRIAVLRQPGFDAPADAAAISAVEEAAGILLDAGAILEQVTPVLPDIRPAFGRLRDIGLARIVAAVPDTDRGRLDAGLVAAAAAGAAMPASDLADAEAVRMAVAHAMAGLHARFDLCLCPTVPAGPMLANAPLPDAADASWTALFSLSRQPALTVPMATGTDGMPRSVQFAAASHRDDLVLRAGWAIEQAGGFPSAPLER